MKALVDNEGRTYLVEEGKDFHNKDGTIKAAALIPGKITTNTGKTFSCYEANFLDKLQNIYRGPATMHQKDIGYLLAHLPITKESIIIDAGTGCGILAAFLARTSNHVTSYEQRKEHLAIAEKNFTLLGVSVTTKNKNIYEGIEEKEVDIITLDLLEPWNVLPHAQKALKTGGYVTAYVTNTSQMSQFIETARTTGFVIERAIETNERAWEVEGLKIRPQHVGLQHTGFLVIIRKC
ncbi:MAG: methyltransferase [Nanoarchaeota archaeon]|nr:methyltransferase [Nanoarchaeota archaeon]